jgi:hypothetical protein
MAGTMWLTRGPRNRSTTWPWILRVVVTFATEDLFKCLVTHSSVALETRTKAFDDAEVGPEFRAFWQNHDPINPLANVQPVDYDPDVILP